MLSRRSASNNSAVVQPKLTDQLFSAKKRLTDDSKQLKNSQANSKKFKADLVANVSKVVRQSQASSKIKAYIDDDDDIAEFDTIEDFEEQEPQDIIVHKGIDDDFEARKNAQPKTKPRNIEIHAEHLSNTDKVLRSFDLNNAYGPAVGMTRLERWERAMSLGLNPPSDILDILKSSGRDPNIIESLFDGRV